jgi:hypothetical protein
MQATTSKNDAPVWHGRVGVYWRDDQYGNKNVALFVGGLQVGSILYAGTHAPRQRFPYRAWIMTDGDGKSLGWYATEDEAKVVLLDVAVREISVGARHGSS